MHSTLTARAAFSGRARTRPAPWARGTTKSLTLIIATAREKDVAAAAGFIMLPSKFTPLLDDALAVDDAADTTRHHDVPTTISADAVPGLASSIPTPSYLTGFCVAPMGDIDVECVDAADFTGRSTCD